MEGSASLNGCCSFLGAYKDTWLLEMLPSAAYEGLRGGGQVSLSTLRSLQKWQ